MMVKFICSIYLFFGCVMSFAQNKISVDSLVRNAEFEIYKNPDIAIRIGDSLLKTQQNTVTKININLLLSNSYISKRNFDKSLQYILTAKKLANETNDTQKKISVLSSIAIQYQQMELFNKSLEILDNLDVALSNFKGNDLEKYYQIARSFAIRGMIYKSQGNSEIALEKFLLSIKNFEKGKQSKPTFVNMSVINYNIGYAYLNLKNTDKAETYFKKANEFAQKTDTKSLEAFALKGLAETYATKNQNGKAIELLEKAEYLSSAVGDLTLNIGIYKLLAENYLIVNNFENYQIYYRKYQSVKFEKEQNELKSINTIIDSHTSEKLDQIQNIQKKYKREQIIITITGIILLLILIYFIREKKTKNAALQTEIQKLL